MTDEKTKRAEVFSRELEEIENIERVRVLQDRVEFLTGILREAKGMLYEAQRHVVRGPRRIDVRAARKANQDVP